MKVVIRPLREEDAFTSVSWRNRPEVWALTASSPDRVITVEDELTWIRRATADPSSRRFAIIADDAYVGNIYLTDLTRRSGVYHIFIGETAYWGRGIARAASEQIIRLAREELGLSTIELSVHGDNLAACRLYTSLGFVQTGVDGAFKRMTLDLGARRATTSEC